jgi:PBSX family phage terminase large subunit
MLLLTRDDDAELNRLLADVSENQLLSIVDCRRRKLSLWYGSVSAGKTVASLIAFLHAVRAAPRKGLIIIVGKTLGTIYANVFTLLQDRDIFGHKLASQVIYTPGATSATILGREVLLVGANDRKSVGNIQGKTVALAYVDEAALLPEEFWNMLVTRLRVAGARLLATMNPASVNHYLYKKWILRSDEHDLVAFHFTMADNPHLPADYVAQMERAFAGVFYDRMIKGLWTNAAGAVYPMWNPDVHVIPWDSMPRISRVIGTGIDFGTSNASAALMLGVTAEEKPRLILMDEWRYDPRDHAGARLAPSEQAAAYKAWLAARHAPQPSLPQLEFQIIDPAAAHFREELFRAGITTWEADNEVSAGIATVSRLIQNGQLISTDRCAGWNTEITEYAWDEKATNEGRDEPVKTDDHSLDGGRYITHTTRQSYEYDIAA